MSQSNKLLGVLANRNAIYFQNIFNILPNTNLIEANAGGKKVTFENIANDSHVASVMQSRLSGVMSYNHEVQGSDAKIVDFCNNLLKKIGITRLMKDILSAVFFGYSVLEIIYWFDEINGTSNLIPMKVEAKPIDWFCFDGNNRPKLRTTDNPDGIMLPPRKFLVVQHNPNYLNPYGDPVLSKCLWPVVFKKGGLTFWMRFVEKFGMPHFIGKTTSQSGTAEHDEFIEQLDSLIQDASAVIGDDESIDAVNGATSINANLYKDLLNWCNTEISKAVLSETLTTELDGTGSFAAGQVHADVRQNVIDSDKKMVEENVNLLLQWAVDMNFPNAEIPTFVMFPKEDVDKNLAEVTDLLTKNKMIQFSKKYYIDRFGFAEDEFELLDVTTTPAVTSQPKTKFAEFAESIYPDQILIDSFTDRAIDEGSKQYEDLAKQITKFVNNYNSFEEVKDNIHLLLPKLSTKDIESKLVNIQFLSDTLGRISVEKELINE